MSSYIPYRPPTRSFVRERLSLLTRDEAPNDHAWWVRHRRALEAYLQTPAWVYEEEAEREQPRA